VEEEEEEEEAVVRSLTKDALDDCQSIHQSLSLSLSLSTAAAFFYIIINV